MFGSTKRPGMRGANSIGMGGIIRGGIRRGRSVGFRRLTRGFGSLSGTVFTEATLGSDQPPQITWYTVQDTTSKVNGVPMITESGATSQTKDEVQEDLRRAGRVAPRYIVTFFASAADQTTFINKVRASASGEGGGVIQSLDKMFGVTIPTSSEQVAGLPTKTKVAIGAGVAVAAYLLFWRK